jgi:hypothetical protein
MNIFLLMQMLKPIVSVAFGSNELAPMLTMQQVVQQDTALNNYFWQSILNENIMKKQRESYQATILAQALSTGTTKTKEDPGNQSKNERDVSRIYTITYFNPELQKTEVLESKSDIKIQDPTLKSMEESVASQSTYPIYQFIAAPLIRTEVVPWKLEQILSEREYGTPPPPPSGAATAPVTLVTQKESEIVAVKKREEDLKVAVSEVVVRKEKSELKIHEEILLLDEAVAALRDGDNIDKVLNRLPPLSRARFILARRKKQLGRLAIIALLLRDVSFLKSIKKKLELFTLDDLVNMYKMLRQLQKR